MGSGGGTCVRMLLVGCGCQLPSHTSDVEDLLLPVLETVMSAW